MQNNNQDDHKEIAAMVDSKKVEFSDNSPEFMPEFKITPDELGMIGEYHLSKYYAYNYNSASGYISFSDIAESNYAISRFNDVMDALSPGEIRDKLHSKYEEKQRILDQIDENFIKDLDAL
jgi:hypothetical protein